MSYENAPATRMLATTCAACGRPLLDSVSVEIGMGPDCRKKYGAPADIAPELRKEANGIIYRIALANESRDPESMFTVAADAEQLRALGFVKLAERVLERTCRVTILEAGGRLVVKTAYDENAVAQFRMVGGRRWDGEQKAWTFPAFRRPEIWALLKRCFSGTVGMGPRGLFQI